MADTPAPKQSITVTVEPTLPPPPPKPATKTEVRQIQDDDVLDVAGLGAWADIITVSFLSIVCVAIGIGLIRKIFEIVFGSTDDKRDRALDQEKVWFDLFVRDAKSAHDVAERRKVLGSMEA